MTFTIIFIVTHVSDRHGVSLAMAYPVVWHRIVTKGAPMRLPRLHGEIERRLLVNYRVDPEVVARLLPSPFRPKLIAESAVAGICLIRLAAMRPAGVPRWVGLRSENAAHRIAVEWDDVGGTRSGVYIPRRDSSSWVNIALGGRVYPGHHHRARFTVSETGDETRVAFAARDGSAHADVAVRVTQDMARTALFATLKEASDFFEDGADGYSATPVATQFDGLQLRTSAWKVEPAAVLHASSSFFDDDEAFPPGTAVLDNALLMRKVPVEWLPLQRMVTVSAE